MKTIKLKLYNYEELSPKAQERALSDRNTEHYDPLLQAHLGNLLKEELEERKMAYDVDSINVMYDLSHTQGSGLMFEGTLYPDYGAGACYEARIKHSGHYYHKYSRTIEWLDADTGEEADTDSKDYKRFEKEYNAICDKIEQTGYDEIEYQTSSEYFAEECEANGYTFEADGKMRNV